MLIKHYAWWLSHLITGTSVKKITATDADEPGNENSQIAYTLIDQNPAHDMFKISNDGIIYVNKNTLDREVQMSKPSWVFENPKIS